MRPPQIEMSTPAQVPETREHPLAVLQRTPQWQELLRCWEARRQQWVSAAASPSLQEWQALVLLGTCVGFFERELRPDAAAHQYIFPRLLEDVNRLHEQLSAQATDLHSPALLHQVFDYGVQWVYYMDWDLYISQELY
jgi:hypothetical protein